ncbi:MAG TPA: hypothetical protein VEH00_06910 [Steroidobacteraceae bacterium]|nr:hypothetical protein [Steroidobacteraceae bacterium]
MDAAGFITVNGQAATAENLTQTVASLNPREVCFAPVALNGRPPAEIKFAFNTVTKLKLPVYLYSDQTFQTRIRYATLPSNNRWRGP